MIQNKKINKNILLISPLDNFSMKKIDSYPSGALVLLGTILYNKGLNVKIVHMSADKTGTAELENIIVGFSPDIVGITVNTYQTKFTKEASRIIKEMDKNILVVAGVLTPRR